MEASDNIEKILQNNFNIEDNLSFEDVEKFADYIKNNNKNVNNILLQFESITSQFEKELETIVDKFVGNLQFLKSKLSIIKALVGFLYRHDFNGILRELLKSRSKNRDIKKI